MSYSEDDYLQLSGLQHFAFCRRQWALIHVEQQWRENLRTVEGNILNNYSGKICHIGVKESYDAEEVLMI